MSAKAKKIVLLIPILIGIAVCIWGFVSRYNIIGVIVSRTSSGNTMATTSEPDTGVIIVTTSYLTSPVLNTDPDQRITVSLIDSNIAWEKAVNGVPVKRFPVNGPPIDLVDPATIGVTHKIAYRILEDQGTEKARFAYFKHRSLEPPSGWYSAALSAKR